MGLLDEILAQAAPNQQAPAAVAAQQSGLHEQELLQHLAQNLPQIVSKLTANGTTMPSLAQVAAALTQQQ